MPSLFEEVDNASLVFFRVAFGLLTLFESCHDLLAGWVADYYAGPQFHFTYYGFGWVTAWPAAGIYLHYAVLCALSVLITLGLFYRVSAALFFLGTLYVFLLEQAAYVNHVYLICLLALLMTFIPAHRSFSLDARRGAVARTRRAPAWCLYVLRLQIGVVYVFAGIAKIDGDWLRGHPLDWWLSLKQPWPALGRIVGWETLGGLLAWGGMLFDLTIVPLMLWRRTRRLGLLLAVAFHTFNSYVFGVASFPWLALALTLLYLPPDFPRGVARALAPRVRFLGAALRGAADAPAAGRPSPLDRRPSTSMRLASALLIAYCALQVLVPLRHWVYPGDVAWTEEGHMFSWRMMLRAKVGRARFTVTDPGTGEQWRVRPGRYLSDWQIKEVYSRPDAILQFCHFLARDFRRRGIDGVEVRAEVLTSLNGRPARPLVDPAVDLAARRRSWRHYDWILPPD